MFDDDGIQVHAERDDILRANRKGQLSPHSGVDARPLQDPGILIGPLAELGVVGAVTEELQHGEVCATAMQFSNVDHNSAVKSISA